MDTFFDWHKWNATSCKTAEEIEKFLNENGIYEKTIFSVKVIGMAENMEKASYIQQLRTTLAKVGVSYDLIDSGKFPNMDKTLLPCEVSICEPVVIMFEDNTTLEMQIYRDGTIKMAINQIPQDVTNGLNFSNFDADRLFSKLKGASIRGISLINRTIESQSGRSSHAETRHFKKLQFDVSGDYGFYLEKGYDNWYRLGLCEYHCYTDFGWETSRITYDLLQQAAKPRQQIVIVEGHDSSSYFWIMPVKSISKKQEWEVKVEEYRPEEISIEEDDVGSMLYYFLDQFFDANLQEQFRDTRLYGLDFEWNLEYNVFTYDSIRKMIAKIREYTKILSLDYDNPVLDELKEKFYPSQFDSEYYYYRNPPKKEDVIRENIYVAIEFYERFCNRMESMMDNAPQFNLISFIGP